jgi:hypothetical protein
MPATRKVKCRRNKKQHGGGLGGVVTFAPASHTMNNPLAFATTSSCLSSTRPGTIASYSANGLPGMSGGRRNRKSKKTRNTRRNKKQNGGAYGFDGAADFIAGTRASYPAITSIGCTGASQTAIPASGATGSLNMRGSELWDAPPGGASPLQSGGSYQLGETLRTAAYTQLDGSPNSTFGTAAGTVLSVNIPVDGRTSGCAMQGGRRSKKSKKAKSKKAKSKKSKRN